MILILKKPNTTIFSKALFDFYIKRDPPALFGNVGEGSTTIVIPLERELSIFWLC